MDIQKLHDCVSKVDSLFASDCNSEKKTAVIIDVNCNKSDRVVIPQTYINSYISGPALGARLWADYVSDNDEPIVITCGSLALSGLPYTDTVTITFRSPQNGLLLHHTVSGTFVRRMAYCKIYAIVIKGCSKEPCIVDVGRDSVLESPIHSAKQYTGFGIFEIERLCRNTDSDVFVIGKAGLNRVLHACCVYKSHSTGRGGLGCVLGSKGIFAIRITCPVMECQNIDTYQAETLRSARKSSKSEQYIKKEGLFFYADNAVKRHFAPVDNFSGNSDMRMYHVTGFELCRNLDSSSTDSMSASGALMLGPNCGCFDIRTIKDRYRYCTDLGMDCVTTGNILGAARPHLDNLDFTDNKTVMKLIDELAEGPECDLYLCPRHCIGNLECEYDYRGAVTSALNSGLGNLFPVWFDLASSLCENNQALWCAFNEELTLGYESYGINNLAILFSIIDQISPFKRLLCTKFPFLVRKILTPFLYEDALEIENGQIIRAGQRCWRLLYEINNCLGLSVEMPDYFRTVPSPSISECGIVPFTQLFVDYSSLRNRTVANQG